MENRILGLLLSALFASEPRGVKAELPAKTEQRQEVTERDILQHVSSDPRISLIIKIQAVQK